MQTKIIVNSIKDGQDRNIALLTNVGNILELRYNAEIKQVEFYRNNGYLGALSSREKLEGFVI